MVTDMDHTLSPEDRIRGEMLMHRADDLTEFRALTSPFVGVGIALTHSEYFVTAAVLAEIYTDYKDGSDARKGADILGVETSVDGAIEDPKADKILANSLMLGHLCRFVRRKDPVGAAIVAGNYFISRRRDDNMQNDRDLAIEHGVDPKAIPINKLKFLLQMVGNTMLSSPLSRNKRIRMIGLSALSGGTAIGLVGERIFRRRVQNAIKLEEQTQAEACPYAVSTTP